MLRYALILAALVLPFEGGRAAPPQGPNHPKARHASASPAKPVPIDRVAAAKHPRLLFATSLPAGERRVLRSFGGTAAAPPVLLPDDPTLLQTAIATVGPTWYAVTFEGAGYSVFVMGRAASVSMTGLRVFGPVDARFRRPRISRTHEIVTATFTAWGASYDVDIECIGGVAHPMCGDSHLVRDLVWQLARLGGEP